MTSLEQVPVRSQDLKNSEKIFSEALQNEKIVNAGIDKITDTVLGCMHKVGLREQGIPDTEVFAVLIHFIIQEYGGHTCQEIALAFNMAITGKLDLKESDIPCYGDFSCMYFARIMNAYRSWSSQEYRQMEKAAPIPIENKEDVSDKGMEDWLNSEIWEYKQRYIEKQPEFLPYHLYDYLDRLGRIVKTLEEKHEYMQRAIARRQAWLIYQQEQFPGGKETEALRAFNAMKSAGVFQEDEARALKILAKQMILNEFIKSQL